MRRGLAALLLLLLHLRATGVARADDAADLAAITAAVPVCDAARAHCFGLQLHVVAGERGGFVVTPAWIAAQVATANKHFAALGVGFQLAGVDGLPASAAHIETRGQRNQLAAHLGGPVVHVFFIAKLADVDEPGAPVYGVTWRVPKDDRKYVIVAGNAFERTLAHELGHVFGLPHSEYAISIMNKTKRDQPPMDERRFADEELAAMKPTVAELVRHKVLAELKPAS